MAKEHFITRKPHVNSAAGKFEFPNLTFYVPEASAIGLSQAWNGKIVTNPNDRRAIANLLRIISNSPLALAAIRNGTK